MNFGIVVNEESAGQVLGKLAIGTYDGKVFLGISETGTMDDLKPLLIAHVDSEGKTHLELSADIITYSSVASLSAQ